MNLYRALVKKNDSSLAGAGFDKTKNGGVQIYIEAYHRDISSDFYPWALPAKDGTGGSSSFGISCIPEIGSWVWVFFDDEEFHRNPFYVWDLNPSGLNPHNLYNANVKSAVGAASEYPDVKYIYLKNGVCIALSSNASNPEITVYHPSASMFIDKAGVITIKNANNHQIVIDGTGITLDAGTEPFVLGTQLNTYLTNLINTTFNTHTHICAAPGAPSAVPLPLGIAPVGILSTVIKGK